MLSIPTLCSGILGFFLLCTKILIFPLSSMAGTPIHGARQAGMATAFTAIADDPSAIVMNPAGITQLKNDTLYSGVTVISPSTTYQNLSGAEQTTKS
jgi:long-subunit fatty acid transport protein